MKKSDEHNENEYKILKRNYNKELKTAKNNYYLNKIKNAKNDTKKIWTIINELLNHSRYNDKFDKIIHNNQEITDEYDIANTLSEFYKSAAYNKIKEIKSDRHFTEFLDYSNGNGILLISNKLIFMTHGNILNQSGQNYLAVSMDFLVNS